MLKRAEVERAVALQVRGYALLRWLEGALDAGFVTPDAADRYASAEERARAWLDRHWHNLPDAARPPRDELDAFARLFCSYLECTFDLDPAPEERRESEDAHCFCPICAWLARGPHLRPKKPRAADRRRAERLQRDAVAALAAEVGVALADEETAALVADPELREALGLVAYARDLLRRLEGLSVGPATLVLWRRFAWTARGAPRKGFRLTADAVLDAQQALIGRIVATRD